MKPSLSVSLLQTLQKGANQLSDEARHRVGDFVESQRTDGESFINRGGKTDLYYTMFGWMLCYVLKFPTSRKGREAFLAGIDPGDLDDLHQTVLTICQMLHRLLAAPRFTPIGLLQWIDDAPLRRFLSAYEQQGSGEATNAMASRLVLSTATDVSEADLLLHMQHETGGFLAHEHSLMPDMLSTAVALFALRQHAIRPRFDARPFIEAHWTDEGGFLPTLLDEHSDTEYVFYGLLAIGSLT